MLKRHLAPQTLDKLLHNELCPQEETDLDSNPVARLKNKILQSMKEADDYDEK
jgi:hypothetical protein